MQAEKEVTTSEREKEQEDNGPVGHRMESALYTEWDRMLKDFQQKSDL